MQLTLVTKVMETITKHRPDETMVLISNWELQSKLLKTSFPQLTNSDLKLDHGQEEELLLRLESKIGLKREDVVRILTNGI